MYLCQANKGLKRGATAAIPSEADCFLWRSPLSSLLTSPLCLSLETSSSGFCKTSLTFIDNFAEQESTRNYSRKSFYLQSVMKTTRRNGRKQQCSNFKIGENMASLRWEGLQEESAVGEIKAPPQIIKLRSPCKHSLSNGTRFLSSFYLPWGILYNIKS